MQYSISFSVPMFWEVLIMNMSLWVRLIHPSNCTLTSSKENSSQHWTETEIKYQDLSVFQCSEICSATIKITKWSWKYYLPVLMRKVNNAKNVVNPNCTEIILKETAQWVIVNDTNSKMDQLMNRKKCYRKNMTRTI